MCKPRPALFKWRHFEPAIITCAVGWYLRFSLSYRNVEELLTERGLPADHTTIWRWVQCYESTSRSGVRLQSFACETEDTSAGIRHGDESDDHWVDVAENGA